MDCAFPETRNYMEQKLILVATIALRWPLPWPLCAPRAKRSFAAPRRPVSPSPDFSRCWNQWWKDNHEGHEGRIFNLRFLIFDFLIICATLCVNQWQGSLV